MSDQIVLEALPFEEAKEYWKNKVPITRKEFDALEDDVKSIAFTVAGYTSLQILDDIHSALQKAIDEGLTLEDFRKDANSLLERRGYKGMTPFQADNVFRTNIQTAFNVGRYKQMVDPETLTERPYWEYSSVNDDATRPTHRALHGKVYLADHPFWKTWYPPNGFRCRCMVRNRTKAEIEARGKKVSEDIPEMVTLPGGISAQQLIPDLGFSKNPAEQAWQPDLSKFTEDFKKAFEKRQKKK